MLLKEGKWTPRLESALAPIAPVLKPLLLFRILKLQTDARLAWSLFHWAAQLPNFTHNEYTCCALIEVLGRGKEFQLIWQLLVAMREGGITVTAVPFTTLINSYGRVGMVEEAEESFRSMEDFGCMPDVYTYSALLDALLKAHDVKKALATLTAMIRSECAPDAAFYTTLITGLSANGDFDQVAKFLEEMTSKDCALHVWTYNALIHSFLKAGQAERAFGTVTQMLAKGCAPDAVTHNTFIDWFCKEGRIDEALESFDRMKVPACAPTTRTHNTLVDGLFKAGRADVALSTIQTMIAKGCNPNTVTYTTWIKWLCDEDKIDEALKLLDRMKESSEKVPDVKTYTVIINGLFKAGRAHMVSSVFKTMIAEGYTPDALMLNSLIKGFCRERRTDDVLWLVQQMKDRGFYPDITTLMTLMTSLLEIGRAENNALASQLVVECEPRIDLVRNCTAIQELCREGKVDEVVKAWDEMRKQGFGLDFETYNTMVISLSMAGRTEKAFLVFTEMIERGCFSHVAAVYMAGQRQQS